MKSELYHQGPQWAIDANHVIFRAATLIEAYANKRHEKYAITQSGIAVLYALVEHEGKIPQKQLTKILDRTKQATASALTTLEKRQLIAREVGAQDHRRRIVSITEKGLQVARECLPLREQYYNYFISSVEEGEGQRLTAILSKLCDNLVEDTKKSSKSK